MTFRIPNATEEAWLDLILAVNYTIRLFTNDVEAGLTEAQKEALTAADFTEASFTGYAGIALTGGSWVTTQGDDESTGTYAQQTFTRTATGAAQVIRGYYYTLTTGGNLRGYEYFPGPITVTNNGDAIVVTPAITLDDHREATVAARGIVAEMTPLTANSTGYTADVTTDFAIANVPTDATRTYAVRIHTQWQLSAVSAWSVDLYADAVLVDRLTFIEEQGAARRYLDATIVWEPATGTPDVDVRIDEISGTSTLTFEGSPGRPRRFWVEDIGPR